MELHYISTLHLALSLILTLSLLTIYKLSSTWNHT